MPRSNPGVRQAVSSELPVRKASVSFLNCYEVRFPAKRHRRAWLLGTSALIFGYPFHPWEYLICGCILRTRTAAPAVTPRHGDGLACPNSKARRKQ
jgi:hypothetical protein